MAVIAGARARGFDCLTVADVNRWGLSDEEQLTFAAEHDRAVFTSNTGDFRRIHNSWFEQQRRHSGIVVLSDQRMPVGDQLRALDQLAATFSPSDMRNLFLFLANSRPPEPG